MTTETIDLGIHLGATNSRIAVSRGERVTVIPNGEGAGFTPTAVWLDEEEHLVVGSRALSRVRSDPDNVLTGFVKRLGSGELLRFARSSQVADPTDLVAAVIRSLRADAARRLGRYVEDAVLTAPSRFGPKQRQALAVAARKAGLVYSPLLQEPIAAALAYGGPSEGATWLVYHFAGSSFDAALVTREGGVVEVVSHAFDDRLGGDQLDWEIVRKVFVPAVFQEAQVTAFHSDNPQWRVAFATLREAAEEVRLKLESQPDAEVRISFLCRDDAGAPLPFRLTVDRTDLNRLLRVAVRRSLKVCEGLLKKRGIKYGDLERVVLAGGPTHDPFFAESLANAGVTTSALAGGVDPFTVIAEGAAVYAGREPAVRAAPPVFVEGEEAVPEPAPEVVPEPEAEVEERADEEVAGGEAEAEAAEAAEETVEAGAEFEETVAAPGEAETEAEVSGAAEIAEAEPEPAAEAVAAEPGPPALAEAPAEGGEAEDAGGTSEERTIALAASHARAGRHTDAKNVLRRLGPGDKLSPAALDMLIRIYTDQGRQDMAQLVWRVGKSRDVVEGDAYDAEVYALANAPARPAPEAAPQAAADVSLPVEAPATPDVPAEPAPAVEAPEPETAVEEPAPVPDEEPFSETFTAAATEPLVEMREAAGEEESALEAFLAEEVSEAPAPAAETAETETAIVEAEPAAAAEEPVAESPELAEAEPQAPTPGAAEAPELPEEPAPAIEATEPGIAAEEPPSETEADTVALAAGHAKAGRYADAKQVLRQLGPGDKLSPATLDILIRIYTSEGRSDRAELVWSFAKSRGVVEGEAYEPERYTLEGWQPAPATSLTAEDYPVPTDDVGSTEQEILAAATRDARAGRHAAAEGRLLSLGPVEELSPTAFDMLIRFYTSEGRGDRAELVWRFGKSRGLVEGDAYDPERYKLEEAPIGEPFPPPPDGSAAVGPEPAGGVSPAPEDDAEGLWAAVNAQGSFIDRPLATGSSSFMSTDAARDDARPREDDVKSAGGDRPPESPGTLGGRVWRLPAVAALVLGAALLAVAVVLLVRGCDSMSAVTPQAGLSPAVSSATPTAASGPSSSATSSPEASTVPQPGLAEMDLDVAEITVDVRDALVVVTFDAGLFPSGFASPTPDGLSTLRELAAELAPFSAAIAIHVLGSADSVPVGPHCEYPSNVALATARAETVVDLLHLEAGLPYAALSVSTVDLSHPLASNSTPEGRARNRTVLLEIREGSA